MNGWWVQFDSELAMLNALKQAWLRMRNLDVQVSPRRYAGHVNAVREAIRHLERDSVQGAETLRHYLETPPDLQTPQDTSGLVGRRNARATIDRMAALCVHADRVLGLKPYDVQILAALSLLDGHVVEMATGEGKTLAACLAAGCRALSRQSTHVLTFNDYLAKRDAEWMREFYSGIGVEVGCLGQATADAAKRRAYASRVTYLTARQAAFDYLSDRLCLSESERIQGPLPHAIVDEADSLLIDEARIPLVVAGVTTDPAPDRRKFAEIVRQLRAGVDFQVDPALRNVHLTDVGLTRVEALLGCGPLHQSQNVAELSQLNAALHAECLLQRDVDYLVRDQRIVLIDELTGRTADLRRWPYGLQEALETKEGVPVQPSGTILQSMTLQNFLLQYESLSGMTGTAMESAAEFMEFYELSMVVVPTHRPCQRVDHPDQFCLSRVEKLARIVDEVCRQHATGRPILIGTRSVEESEEIAARLRQAGVSLQVLNARHDEAEAAIISEAGALGAVTVSTNMAGRGTDILLGGSQAETREQVEALGGLLVIGTSRQESRRLDRQLRGRAGRQGEPGATQFFVSGEDALFKRFAGDSLPLDPAIAGAPLARLQRIVENESYEIRRTLRKYAACLENQRVRMVAQRERWLRADSPPESLLQAAPKRHEQMCAAWGQDRCVRLECLVFVRILDACWAEHLELASELRESIHLVSLGGLNAFDSFNQRLNVAFRNLFEDVDERACGLLSELDLSQDLDEHALLQRLPQRPSSYWTYMINDHPAGDLVGKLQRRVSSMLRKIRVAKPTSEA